jgi:hypothetical protein
VGVSGFLDSFPAFEAYANYNNGVTKTLFQKACPEGAFGPLLLIGGAAEPIAAAVSFA